MSNTRFLFISALFPLIILLSASLALAQTTTFTYQGRLTDGDTPANGVYDLQFALFDSSSSGAKRRLPLVHKGWKGLQVHKAYPLRHTLQRLGHRV